MPTPIFIVAGQSNVAFLSDEIEDSLEAEFGVGNFELLRVFDSGAPLTRERPDKPDWSSSDELREILTVETVDALLVDDDRTFGGLMWVQGEADTYFPNGAGQYGEKLEELLDGFRDDVASVFDDVDVGIEDAPVTILELSDNAPAASEREGWETIIDEQRAVAEDDSLVQSLDPDTVAEDANVAEAAMFLDGLHYSDEFSCVLADELVQTMVDPQDENGIVDEPVHVVAKPSDPVVVVEEPADRIEDEQPSGDDQPEPLLPVIDIPQPTQEEEDGDNMDDMGDTAGFEAIFWVLPILGLIAGLG